MSNEMWRYVISGFLILHGIGHSGGYWMFVKSWLSPGLVNAPLKWLFVVVWLVAMMGYFAAGVGLLQMQSGWRTVAVAASVVSLVVSVLYIQGAPFSAAVADIIILVALLVLRWPGAKIVGS
jgi:hypothetical protein